MKNIFKKTVCMLMIMTCIATIGNVSTVNASNKISNTLSISFNCGLQMDLTATFKQSSKGEYLYYSGDYKVTDKGMSQSSHVSAIKLDKYLGRFTVTVTGVDSQEKQIWIVGCPEGVVNWNLEG